MAVAGDVPNKFDVVINSEGYRFADTEARRAVYALSPTFVPRTNVDGDYGDNKQDFWLTFTQRDWSLGEQQKFYRQSENQSRRYWRGTNVDVQTAGQVTLRKAVATATFAAAVRACHAWQPSGNDAINAAGVTNLYEISAIGAITDKGAHGLGATPSKYGIVTDAVDTYISTTTAGTVGVRKWNGTAFSTFSANGADILEYLNNTLYGLRVDANGDLVRWDSAGTLTSLFPWRQVDAGAIGAQVMQAYGGKLLIALFSGNGYGIWVYDGTAPAKVAEFPSAFSLHSMEVVMGVAFCGGCHVTKTAAGTGYHQRPCIYFYVNGTLGLLWQSDTIITAAGPQVNAPALAPSDAGLVFNDDTTGRLMFYDMSQGGIHAVGSYTVGSGGPALLAASSTSLLMTRNETTAYLYPDPSTVATSGTITTSLTDFDSSLEKHFKAIKVDYDEGSDGDGGSIDIAYRLNDLDGSYTTLQSGATAGTEYVIGTNGRAISVQITLNKGTSTSGPVLKRIYVRAAPVQQAFKRREYVLDLSGRNGVSPLLLRDGTPHPKDGLTMATNLNTAATMTTPITVTDRFSTYTGIVDPEGYQLTEVRPEEFLAVVRVREV
jgi:hypothetical protein